MISETVADPGHGEPGAPAEGSTVACRRANGDAATEADFPGGSVGPGDDAVSDSATEPTKGEAEVRGFRGFN
ncbi:MAG: hypothetical protein U0930_20020 [Pirellulales bacterium]